MEHDDIIKWKHFPRDWSFVKGIHRLFKGRWRGALMFSFIYAWTIGWANNWDAGDLRCHRALYYVTVKTKYVSSVYTYLQCNSTSKFNGVNVVTHHHIHVYINQFCMISINNGSTNYSLFTFANMIFVVMELCGFLCKLSYDTSSKITAISGNFPVSKTLECISPNVYWGAFSRVNKKNLDLNCPQTTFYALLWRNRGILSSKGQNLTGPVWGPLGHVFRLKSDKMFEQK